MKIGIFTSSKSITLICPQRTKRSLNFLNNKKNEIVLGKLFYKEDFYRSGSIEERAEEVNDLISQNVDILMSSIGGTNTNSILPFVNYDLINEKEIMISGYSDTTALLLAVISKCPKSRVFYGPALLPSFGDFESYCLKLTYDSFLQAIKKDEYKINFPKTWTDDKINWENFETNKNMKKNVMIFSNDKKIIEGRMIGGNLNTIIGTFGSTYGLKINKGDILLIEDSCKDAETVEKNFSFLKLNNFHKICSMFIVGKHEQFDDQGTGKTPLDIFLEIFGNDIDYVYGVDFCHTKPMVVIELNKIYIIDFIKKEFYRKEVY